MKHLYKHITSAGCLHRNPASRLPSSSSLERPISSSSSSPVSMMSLPSSLRPNSCRRRRFRSSLAPLCSGRDADRDGVQHGSHGRTSRVTRAYNTVTRAYNTVTRVYNTSHTGVLHGHTGVQHGSQGRITRTKQAYNTGHKGVQHGLNGRTIWVTQTYNMGHTSVQQESHGSKKRVTRSNSTGHKGVQYGSHGSTGNTGIQLESIGNTLPSPSPAGSPSTYWAARATETG